MAKARIPRSVLALCASHFLSTWGDRMWSYAVALFLVEIGCGSLLLPAIFGLVLAAVNFLGSTIVGKWVDKAHRLRVMKISLFSQNILVTICAGFLILLLHLQAGELEAHGSVYYLSLVVVITLSAAANLVGQGTTIAVERDWVVVICGGDDEVLGRTNAIMRRIDLVNKIVSPLPVSFLMSKSVQGLINGAIFIGVWNIVSGFVEYLLLLYTYRLVPALASKSSASSSDVRAGGVGDDSEQERLTTDDELDDTAANGTDHTGDAAESTVQVQVVSGSATPSRSRLAQFLLLLLLPYTTVWNGWKVYRSQPVLRAGLSLSLLYMTVLGFNGITNGFLYSQGLEIWQVSVCQALGALFGVLGTFIYHPLRRRLGTSATGLVAVWSEAACLSLCAASVFLTGNPASTPVQAGVCERSNASGVTASTAWPPASTAAEVFGSGAIADNYSTIPTSYSPLSVTPQDGGLPTSRPVLSTSLVFFLIGIVTARIGLWMFDLVITQLYQMEVPEEHRGVVGGVQSALNSNMDLLHFVLVIAFPSPTQFGGLVLASFGAVVLAALLYSSFARSEIRGPVCTLFSSGHESRGISCCCCSSSSWQHVPVSGGGRSRLRNSPEDGADVPRSQLDTGDDDNVMTITNTAEL